MKHCWDCNQTKSTTEFNRNRTTKDGLSGYCGECNKKRSATYQAKVMDEMFAFYGPGCACCGITRRTFLQLDHVGNDGAADRYARGTQAGFPFVTKLRKAGWPSGYQILCANCHSEKTKLGRCACSDTVISAHEGGESSSYALTRLSLYLVVYPVLLYAHNNCTCNSCTLQTNCI
jgi:hypothetical protein